MVCQKEPKTVSRYVCSLWTTPNRTFTNAAVGKSGMKINQFCDEKKRKSDSGIKRTFRHGVLSCLNYWTETFRIQCTVCWEWIITKLWISVSTTETSFWYQNRNQGPISVSVLEPKLFFPKLKLFFSKSSLKKKIKCLNFIHVSPLIGEYNFL